MKSLQRRRFLQLLATAPAAFVLQTAHAMDCKFEHPFSPPKDAYQRVNIRFEPTCVVHNCEKSWQN